MPRVRTRIEATETPGTRTAVVVAMKPQLRGRIRRNVETLLELGLRVVVVSVRSRKDFFVGLESPLLSAELVDVPTFYRRYSIWLRRDGLRRAYAEQIRLDRARRRHVRRTLRLRAHPWAMLRFFAQQEVFGNPYGRPLRPFPRWLVYLALVLSAPFVFLLGLVHVVVTAAGAVATRVARALGPRAEASLRRLVRAGRHLAHRLVRGSLAAARPGVRLVRRRLWEPVARWARTARQGLVAAVGRLLLKVNRVEIFVRFWSISARVVRREHPDLVVSSDLPGLVGASRAARSLGIRQVHDCHELYLESTSFTLWERRLLAPVERWHMRRVARVVMVNESIADEYRARYGVRADVVRNCANVQVGGRREADLRLMAGLAPDVPVVLYQGGFITGRGLDVCIAAMAGLPESVHLVMLGYGPMAAELGRLAHAHGVGERVHVVPAVPPEELLALTASATIGLIPYQPVSRNNHYTLPNKIFEYTSVGLPVVASDLPELRRVVVDGGCGRVYDPFDAESLTAAMAHVLDPERIDTFRAAAREYGLVNSWVNERTILVDAFEHALAGSRPSETTHVVPKQRVVVP